MKPLTDTLFNELLEDINEYSEMGIVPIKKLSGALRSMRETIRKLKAHILAHPFKSVAEEIQFFKKEKPRFMAEQLYAIDMCVLQTSRPFYDQAVIRAFFESELRMIRSYLKKYAFLYQYYQLDSGDMDELFFVRGAYPKGVLLPDGAEGDPEFSTACDFAWARFMAYERVMEWIIGELNPGGSLPANETRNTGAELPAAGGFSGLKWTGESINLVEIAYGIWLTGQVNHGNVSITEIVEALEVMFRLRIGKAHRRWQSIAGRKRLGYTKYIDEIKAAIEKRVEDELER